jgi:hypothetical protein
MQLFAAVLSPPPATPQRTRQPMLDMWLNPAPDLHTNFANLTPTGIRFLHSPPFANLSPATMTAGRAHAAASDANGMLATVRSFRDHTNPFTAANFLSMN